MLPWCSTGEAMKRKGIAVFLILLLAGAVFGAWRMEPWVHEETFSLEIGPKPETNPLKGWAPWSTEEGGDFPSKLAFVLVSWRELEPEKGEYAFEQVEKENNMDQLRAQGVRFILRVVCDYPGEDLHLNIPDWLYEETQGNGTWYDSEYGKGYSPDYEDPVFLEAHGTLMEAMGERYNQDPYLAYLQLGSLGHWGEWHVDEGVGIAPLPAEKVTDQYILQYVQAFPEKKLLLRRPYALGAEAEMGLYNDSFGQEESHEEWLDWIEEGYRSSENGEQLDGMPEFWKKAPSGGEFASGREIWEYGLEAYDSTMDLLRKSHTSFIGPRGFGGQRLEESELEEEEQKLVKERIQQMSREMGYCFALSGGKIRQTLFKPELEVTLWGENLGIAPIYENWPLVLKLVDEDGQVVWEEQTDGQITSWLPGGWQVAKSLSGSENLPKGTYRLLVGIEDPITGEPGIQFANEKEVQNCLYEAAVFEKQF